MFGAVDMISKSATVNRYWFRLCVLCLCPEIMSADLLEELMSSEGKTGRKPSHLYIIYYWTLDSFETVNTHL